VWEPPAPPAFIGPLPTPAMVELDFGALVRVTGNMSELAVIRPLSLTLARTPALTLGKDDVRVCLTHLPCGQTELNSPSLFLFSFLN